MRRVLQAQANAGRACRVHQRHERGDETPRADVPKQVEVDAHRADVSCKANAAKNLSGAVGMSGVGGVRRVNAEDDAVFSGVGTKRRTLGGPHVILTPAESALVAEPLKGIKPVPNGKLVGFARRSVAMRLIADADHHSIFLPTPSACALAYTLAATATSSMAMPSDLNMRHVLRMRPAGEAADDHLAQLVDVGPVDRAFFQGLDEVAGFDAGLVLAVDDDRVAAAHRDGVHLGLAQEIRADRR